MGNVMVGIAEALVATGVGLFVAIPAVVIFNLIQKKIAEVETGVQVLGKLAGAYLETRASGTEPSPRAAETEASNHQRPVLAAPRAMEES
jgi:biopolymer transport protein ExbB/biopolymer transport protein TolQ